MREASEKVSEDEKGFASVEFILIMAMSILLLTGFLNILFIEFQRDSVLTSMRNASRAGTRIVDLNPNTVTAAQISEAKDECKRVGKEALRDLINDTKLDIQCEVSYNANDVAVMKATVANAATDNAIVPWVVLYEEKRMKNLSESFVQRKAAEDEN